MIAQAGDTEIRLGEIRAAVAALAPEQQAALAGNPAALSQAVRTLVAQRLVLGEATERKWGERPEVRQQLERVQQAALIESYLQSVSQPPAEYPSDDDLVAAYEANKEALRVPTQYRLAQIFIALPRSAEAATEAKAREKLDAVLAALRAPKGDFAAVARAQSEEPVSAARGGDVGWLTEGQLQLGIRAAAVGLQAGGTTEPVRLDDGWHVVKCLERKDAYTPTLDAIEDQLKARLRTERAQAMRQTYLGNLLERKPVAVNEVALGRIMEKEGR